MGLFATIASSTTSSDGGAKLRKSPQTTLISSTTVPTILQIYVRSVNEVDSSTNGGSTRQQPCQSLILMGKTSNITGYTTLTYQSIQVGSFHDDDDVFDFANKYLNPNLGVWNYGVVVTAGNNERPLSRTDRESADQSRTNDMIGSSLNSRFLKKITSQASVFCLTVDLCNEASVEPHLSVIQSALVRILIEQQAAVARDDKVDPTDTSDNEKDDLAATSIGPKSSIQTTSLYDLQAVQFGLASEETSIDHTIEESAKDVKISLMICAVTDKESVDVRNGDTSAVSTSTADISSEVAYKNKQARALVVYHLRKFANAINAALCFVERPEKQQQPSLSRKYNINSNNAVAVSDTDAKTEVSSTDAKTGNSSNGYGQITISYDKLSQLWRDMAMGVPVWESSTKFGCGGNEKAAAVATAIYGPGRQQEDLIENLLLRNANYPGHWDASKNSLWVALPTPSVSPMTIKSTLPATGDGGWLTQLRESNASALPSDKLSLNDRCKADVDNIDTPKEKDAAVSSFFESLLKNP